jgi:uncharacterized protein (TIGR03382 family)
MLEGPVDLWVTLSWEGAPEPLPTLTLAGSFQVTTPGIITAVTPDSVTPGQTATLQISGQDGNFIDGVTTLVIYPETDLEVRSVVVSSADALQAEVAVGPNPPSGAHSLIAVTGGEVAIGTDLLDIFNPQITRVVPSGAFQGTTELQVRVQGQDIPFDASSTIAFSGAGITVGAVTYDAASPDQIEATISVDPAAAIGARDVTATVAGVAYTKPGAFRVLELTTGDGGGGCGCGSGVGAGGAWAWLLALGGWLGRRALRSGRRSTAGSGLAP